MVIQSALKQAFRSESWLAILKEIFHYEYLSLRPYPKSIEIKSAFQENILSGLQLGELSLSDDNNVLLLQITTQEKIDLSRNKIALRAFLIDLLDDSEFDAAIAVFEQADNPNWRISYVSRSIALREDGTHEEIQTAPRRFTFLVGKDEPTRTAAGQLAEIKRAADQLDLAKLEAAFAFEKLSNEFFDRYKALYALFLANIVPSEPYLLQAKYPFKKEKDTANGRLTPYPEHVPEGEDPSRAAATRALFDIVLEETPAAQKKADKPIRDFVKKLLGRLVFLTFLEKKRWLGCPSDTSDWNEGERTFLKDYFAQAGGAEGATAFHSEFLTDLFFQALNTERPNDLFEKTGSRIPYLNGGLFDADPAPQQTLDFPPALFQTLLQFFGEYNFTIDENDPLNKEVGIDPEMLGHIFENLLEDNKDKGAYYTPKPVVSYMCQQSLLHYLQTHFGERPELNDLVTLHKAGDPEDPDSWCHQNAKKIANKLEEVKICDPAIGSGAFPIGMLNEIVHIRTLLNSEFHDPAERAKLKKSIIQKSIYGVDLDLGAVEIARLRFWLALVVDEVIPSPLPNLDYKIMQGNSLLESFRGVDLSELAAPTLKKTSTQLPLGASALTQSELEIYTDAQLELQEKQQEQRNELLEARRAYFAARKPERKAELRTIIDDKVIAHIRHYFEVTLDEEETRHFQVETAWKEKRLKAPKWNPAKAALRRQDSLADHITELKNSLEDLADLQTQPERPFFLWHLLFQDVFSEGGFDIVIANPPYVRHESIKELKSLLETEPYEVYKGTADLLVYFYEQGTKILKENGVLTFITSNKFYRASYGDKVRRFLTTNHTIHTLIDFKDAPVFNGIVAYASILVGQKRKVERDHHISALSWNKEQKIASLPTEIRSAFLLTQESLTSLGWRLILPAENSLYQKIQTKGQALSKVLETDVFRGVTTGFNPAFILKSPESNALKKHLGCEQFIKPYSPGKGLVAWKPLEAKNQILFTRQGFEIEKYKEIEKHLTKFRESLEPKPSDWADSRPWAGRKKGNYKWYEIQDITAYWAQFDELKIVSTKVSDRPNFSIDRNSIYLGNTAYFFKISETQTYVLPLLNSKVFHFYAILRFVDKEGGFFEIQPQGLKEFPIPELHAPQQLQLDELSEKCTQATVDNDLDSLSAHEDAINQIVYRLFELTEDEINLIETTLAS